MADISHALVFEALTRAATAPAGLPLHAAKASPGLFAANAAGKSAAQRCKDDELLRVLRSETKGKHSQEICGITEKGLAFLLHHADPRPVLEAFVTALQARQGVLEAIQEDVHRGQQDLDALKAAAAKVLERLNLEQPVPLGSAVHRNGNSHHGDAGQAMRAQLMQWHEAGLLGDCPLPELFRRLRPAWAQLTIGQFHDHLRLLHEAQQIYLHPWTGPLYELPEPALALLVGHEIAYYASLRV